MRSAALVFLFLVTLVVKTTSVVADERPNVLMIVVDDMNDWVGCLGGHPDVQTPNIDRLAARGLLFTNAHCAAPVCNASRVATLTGRRPGTTGIYENNAVWHQALPGIASLPQHFKANGYYTAGGGKVFHHMPGFNRKSDWDEYFDQVFDGFHQVEVARGADKGDFAWPPGFPLNQLAAVRALANPPSNPYEFDWGPFDSTDAEMGDGRMVEWARKLLTQPPRQPFFLAAGIFRPHLPMYAPRQYFDLYPRDTITPPVIKADDCDDLPKGGQAMAATRRGDLELIQRESKYRDLLQAYLASITFADALIRRLLDSLDASPAAANTIVVLWSDHGWHLGEKEHLHKFTLWERSTRIPFVVAAPGVTQPGTRTTRPVDMTALFPTLNELCSLPAVDGLDGVSIAPLLHDPHAKWDLPAMTTHGRGNHAVRTERWRYIRYADDGGEELYDHETDPNEWTNLAGRPEFAEVQAELAKWVPAVNVPPAKSGKGSKQKTE